MKILYLFFYLIIVSSCNVYSINVKRGVTFNEDLFNEGLSEACIEELNNSEYTECMDEVTKTNFKQLCSSFKSEKCQNFYNNPLNYLPNCKNEPTIKEYYQPINIEYMTIIKELTCLTDEEDNLCPLGIFVISEDYDYDFIKDTCKSKICADSFIKVAKKIKIDHLLTYENLSFTEGAFNYHELNSYNNVVKKLESDDCRFLQNTSLQITSDADTIKKSSVILILSILSSLVPLIIII